MENKIQQHEPLRVPIGWKGQDKALVIQIERVLTSIYKLMGIADSRMVTGVAYDAATKSLTVTIDGETSNIVAVATLDGNGKIPSNQLPSYVDDVSEYPTYGDFPLSGEEDKIYVAMDTGFTYRWSGSQYVRLNTYDPATQSASGLMSAQDKTKLDGIEQGAQVNPGEATASASGLMSAADKTKLNGIATGANVSSIAYDSANKKITLTINGTTTDVVTVSTLKSALGAFTHDQLAGR